MIDLGNSRLEMEMGGGLTEGSILAIVADPATQSDALIYQFMLANPATYITTLRRKDDVERNLSRLSDRLQEYEVQYAGNEVTVDGRLMQEITDSRSLANGSGDGSQLNKTSKYIQSSEESNIIIIDPINPLEYAAKYTELKTVLNQLKETVMANDSLGILHCISSGADPELREVTLTMSDIIWELELRQLETNQHKHYLSEKKNRGKRTIQDQIELDIGLNIDVDDTRNI